MLPLKLIVFVSQFTGHTISLSSSKNILQYLDSTVHQFQEVVIDFSDGPASQFKLGVLLSSITQLGRNSGNNLFATSHCNLGHAHSIG